VWLMIQREGGRGISKKSVNAWPGYFERGWTQREYEIFGKKPVCRNSDRERHEKETFEKKGLSTKIQVRPSTARGKPVKDIKRKHYARACIGEGKRAP